MKKGLRKICIAVLVVIFLLCGCGEAAQSSTTASSDGIVATLTTDKDTYNGLDTAKVSLVVTNNTGKRVNVSTEVKAPENLKLDLGAVRGSFLMEPGQSTALSEIAVEMDPGSIILTIVLVAVGIIGAGAGVTIFIIRKKKTKEVTSMILCLVMLAGILMMTPMAKAAESQAEYVGSLTVSHPVTVDGKTVLIEAVVNYEIGIPEEKKEDDTDDDYYEDDWEDPDCDKPNAKVTAFFYNDFDGDHAMVDGGATMKQNDHLVDIATDDKGNGYLRCEITNELAYSTYQADFKDNRIIDHLVVSFDISTENQIPKNTYMLYRYKSGSNQEVFRFKEDGTLRVLGTDIAGVKVEKDKWLSLDLVFDFTKEGKDYCTIYADDVEVYTVALEKRADQYKIPYVRFYFMHTGNVGKTVLMDNLYVYESDKVLNIDEINSPGYPYWQKPKAGQDVEMEHPELADLGEKTLAVLAGSDSAYVNGQVVKLSKMAQNGSSGDVFTDAYVPADFLETYMGVTGLDKNVMHSILQYASGWNVLVDDRGMILLSKDKKLDAAADVKALTMLYGYINTGELVNNYAVAPRLTQSIIDRAVQEFEAPFVTAVSRSYPAMQAANALYYMVFAAHMYPDITATDGTVVADEAAARIKRMVSGGREPWASVGCFWEHGLVSSVMLLAKETPVIWDQMTEDDIKRIDLLMECLAIAANWGYNKDNDYSAGFDLTGDFGKDYNPNYKNAYFTCYMSASMYFGAEELDEIFVNFQYDSYIERLTEVGFTNILYTWTITDILGISIGEYMQNGGTIVLSGSSDTAEDQVAGALAGSGVGVAVPWAYRDLESGEIYKAGQYVEMFIDTVEYTYSWIVRSDNQAPGSQYYAYIISGERSPWEGQMGMMREFSVADFAPYARSRIQYCYLSSQNICALYANMKLLGYWDYDSQTEEVAQKMREMDNRIYVGTEDLFFKMHEGYRGVSSQHYYEEFESSYNQNQGASYVKDIFMNFHFMKNEDTQMKTTEKALVHAERAEPKDGITTPPAGAIVAKGRSKSLYVPEFYEYFDGLAYKKGTVSFDVVIGDDLLDTNSESIIVVDQKYLGHKSYSESPILIRFMDGVISFYSGGGYQATTLKYGENYRYKFEITFDCATSKYSATVAQTWPETATPVSATVEAYDFRHTAGKFSYLDSIMAINHCGYDDLWVENVQVSGTSMPIPKETNITEVEVSMNIDAVPADKRPEQIKVYLTMNGWTSSRYVTFTAADGWAIKTFDNLPVKIGDKAITWGAACDVEVEGYYARVIEIGDGEFTVLWSDTKYFYNSGFEAWNTGDYKSGNTPIYDSYNNILRDWGDQAGTGALAQGKEANGNHYLQLKNNLPLQGTINLDSNYAKSVYAIKLRMKLESDDAEVPALLFSYRYSEKKTKYNIIEVTKKRLTIGGSPMGALSADEWTDIFVILDFNTLTGEIFNPNDSEERITFDLEVPTSNLLTLYLSGGCTGLCIDDLQIYTQEGMKVAPPENAANKEPEIIDPGTPPAPLDSKYTWYYSADFEYWNKGAYNKLNTPIKDAYGNVLRDTWSNTSDPLVRGDEGNGNHYLLMSGSKEMNGIINVDSEMDDGVYVVKWRMKLENAESKISTFVASYRRGENKKHDFATVTAKNTIVCDYNFGKLTADKWVEVMVVLDYNKLVATVCDWEGNKLGQMAIEPMTSRSISFYAAAECYGLCIDDLQVFSGDVEIKEPEAPPALDPNYTWYYSNNFQNNTVVAGDGDKTVTDPYGKNWADQQDAFKTVTDGENTYLEIGAGEEASQGYIGFTTKTMTVKWKMRLASDSVTLGSNAVIFNYRMPGNKQFGKIHNNTFSITDPSGNGVVSQPLTTQWVDVEVIMNSETGKASYTIGDKTGTFTINTGDIKGFTIYTLANNSGLCIDDLQIHNGGNVLTPPPLQEDMELTVHVAWNDSYNDDGLRPDSVYVSLYDGATLVKRVEVTKAGDWKYTFTEVPKYDGDSNEIQYTVKVETADMPTGYDATVEDMNVTMNHTTANTWYYKQDFEGVTVTAYDSDKRIYDASGSRNLWDQDDQFRTVVEQDGNTCLEIRGDSSSATGLVQFAATKNATVKFRMRLADDAVNLGNSKIIFQYRFSKNAEFAKITTGNKFNKGNVVLTSEWVDVTLVLNSETGACTYTVGDATGNFTIETGDLKGFAIYATQNYGGLYIDDLQIYAQ